MSLNSGLLKLSSLSYSQITEHQEKGTMVRTSRQERRNLARAYRAKRWREVRWSKLQPKAA